MSQKLPVFPIKFHSPTGEALTARFKTAGPKEIKVFIRSRSDLEHSCLLPTPQQEVLSWGRLAAEALAKINTSKETNHVPSPSPLQMSSRKSLPEKVRVEKVKRNPAVLSEVRGVRSVVLVKDADADQLYRTAKSDEQSKRHLCRVEGAAKTAGVFVLQVYFAALREWKSVEVKGDYPLVIHESDSSSNPKEIKSMPTKLKAKPTPPLKAKPGTKLPASANSPKANVYEAWGQAFAAHAAKPNAPKLIVAHMEKTFPGRKTNWTKWVNNVRNLYNTGKLPKTAKPKERIAPYK